MADEMTIKTSQLFAPPSSPAFEAVPWSDSTRLCPCCDGEAHVILGGIFTNNEIQGVYLVSWTQGRPQHAPHIDLILGPWGHESQASARVLITLAYRPQRQRGEFVQIDSVKRLGNDPLYCGRALAAGEAIPPPYADDLPLIVDAIWETEPFINDALASSAYHRGQGRA